MDFDHEPWVETYRQMFFELKLRNYTEIRALQESGAPPPNATTIILPGDFEREDVEVRPAASWREYWVEWERDWHAPSDTGDSLLRGEWVAALGLVVTIVWLYLELLRLLSKLQQR